MQRTSTDESEHWECGDVAPVTIVVGASGSESSLRALVYTIGAARRARGRVIVVYARKPFAAWVVAGGVPVGGAECVLDDSAVAIVSGLAKLIATIKNDADTPIELTRVVGDPARALAKFATTCARISSWSVRRDTGCRSPGARSVAGSTETRNARSPLSRNSRSVSGP